MAHAFFPHLGGLERNVLFTTRALSASADVTVFVPAGPPPPDLPAQTVALPKGLSVARLRSVRLFGERVVLPFTLFRALRRLRPNLVWSHLPGGSADLAGVYGLLTRTPWVVTYHADPLPGTVQRAILITVESWLMRAARVVFVSSNHYTRRLISRGVRRPALVLSLVGPYIGDGTPPVPTVSAADATSEPGDAHPLLFVGRLDQGHRYKRPENLITAISRLAAQGTRIRLDMIGGGDRLAELQKLARSQDITNLVRFRSRVSDRELADAFQGAWALVLPSDSDTEGFGAVCIDAIQYGCPVVGSSAVPGVSMLAGLGSALCFDASQPSDLDLQLLRLWKDPQLRHRLARGALAAREQFRWDTSLQQVVERIHGTLYGTTWPGPGRPKV